MLNISPNSVFSWSQIIFSFRDAGNSIRAFLFQHTSLALDKKGFNDSIGRNPLPSHFELPTLKNWIKAGLFVLLNESEIAIIIVGLYF